MRPTGKPHPASPPGLWPVWAFALLAMAAALSRPIPLWLAWGYGLLNLGTFAVYAFDKNAARQGQPRTPESTLHLLALLGGWPAARLAQRWLHHKSRKTRFLIGYWATVATHCTAAAVVWQWLATPQPTLASSLFNATGIHT